MSAALPLPMDVKLMNRAAAALFAAALVLVMAAAGWWLLRLPAFSIAGITVLGDVAHNSAPTLRANVAPRLAGNFFTVNLAAAQQAFQGAPWVRQAVVKREFPNRLRVLLQEHQPVAYWGADGDSRLVNSFGEVFEANVDDIEQDDLPRLSGPEGDSQAVLAMYRAARPLFEPYDLALVELALTPRGNWIAGLDNGASVELGRGTEAEVVARAQRFLSTLTQVASRYGRRPEALVSADLRHADGYAVRFRGVSTTADAAAKK